MATKSFSDLFSNERARFAQKALDYLDGIQLEHVIALLDQPGSGRSKWQDKGMRPAYRNLTKMVVEKSGLLFMDGTPQVEVWRDGMDSVDDRQTESLNMILNEADWGEFFINLDQVVRLLKTAMVLSQYDSDYDRLTLDILHRGNCVVRTDPITRRPYELVYKIEQDDADEYEYFRVYTPEMVSDWREQKKPGAKPEMIQQEENPYGMIPVSIFYDTRLPRTGTWLEAPCDLIRLNEMYNIHLVDIEFAASWSVHQTLFTNANIVNEATGNISRVEEEYQSPLPRMTGGNNGEVVGGLGRIVQIDTQGIEQVVLEYKGPNLDLEMPTKVFNTWVRDFAEDWSVRVKVAGEGVASSGFQLVVEEMDNLELRKQRSRMFERGLSSMCETIMNMWNVIHPNIFDINSNVYVSFDEPKLPINKKEEEEIWSTRITEGRASLVDYFMKTQQMTREEAEEKVEEIKKYNKESLPQNQSTLNTPAEGTED